MKITKLLTNKPYSVDKNNLRYLLSKTPTNKDNYALITRFENEQGAFIDNRILGNKSVIQLGKSELEIDASNGKILSCSKPFFKSMKKLVNQANEFLTSIITGINDSKKVTKSQTGIFVAGGPLIDEKVRIANQKIEKTVKKTTLEIATFPKEYILKLQKSTQEIAKNLKTELTKSSSQPQ